MPWIYVDKGWRLTGLLRQCQSAQQDSGIYVPSLAFIDRLLSVLPNNDADRQAVHRSILQRDRLVTVQTEDGLPIALSAREIEVLKLIAEGKSNQEISSELYLALNTVKRHAYNIYSKLEVKKRTQAVSKARQLGLIS